MITISTQDYTIDQLNDLADGLSMALLVRYYKGARNKRRISSYARKGF